MPKLRRNRKGGHSQASTMMRILPNYQADPVQTRTFRFKSLLATSVNISQRNLIQLYCCALSATTAAPACQAAKLVSVRLTTFGGGATGSLAANSSSLQWVGANSSAREISIAGNADHPGSVLCKPPFATSSSFWLQDSANNVFLLNLQIGDIVDIVLSTTPANATDTPPTQNTGAAMTVGSYYYAPLDGHTTNVLVPQSNPTTS